jgi:opacity protein-like surface antigen
MKKTLLAAVTALVIAAPASAQVRRPVPNAAPIVSLRPFFMVEGENFTARQTFESIFGSAIQPYWGGGLSVALKNGLFVDVTASRFKKTGERAFFFNGQGFRLGIPLNVTLTPLEVSAGGRFRVTPTIYPYVGAGVGTYRYQETSQGDDAFEVRHTGYLVTGGVEVRVGRWVGLSGDVQYTRIPGIIGTGGVSQQASEDDLGGVSGRFRVIIGR